MGMEFRGRGEVSLCRPFSTRLGEHEGGQLPRHTQEAEAYEVHRGEGNVEVRQEEGCDV